MSSASFFVVHPLLHTPLQVQRINPTPDHTRSHTHTHTHTHTQEFRRRGIGQSRRTLPAQQTTFTSMPAAGLETVIPVVERPQTYASDRAATGTGLLLYIKPKPKFKWDKKRRCKYRLIIHVWPPVKETPAVSRPVCRGSTSFLSDKLHVWRL